MPVVENGNASHDESLGHYEEAEGVLSEKDRQRPAVIKEDLNGMERRKRVRQVLDSSAFKDELEMLMRSEQLHGASVEGLHSLQQLSDVLLPPSSTRLPSTSVHTFGAQAIIPVSDIRGADIAKYSKLERAQRNKLGSLYRLVDLFQWSQGLHNQITLKIDQEQGHFLVNPYGLLYHEITASSLITVDAKGNVINKGSTGLGIDMDEFLLHSALYEARPDVRCIIHLQTAVVSAVSAMKNGLMPISQEALQLGRISYHEQAGFFSEPKEREALAHDLGPTNKVLCIRNFGFLVCSSHLEESLYLARLLLCASEIQILIVRNNGFFVCCTGGVEEAFHLTTNLINACESQVRAARAGLENLHIPTDEAQSRAYELSVANPDEFRRPVSPGGGYRGDGTKWRPGELEWEAWMRLLDNAGFKTGHLYRQAYTAGKAKGVGDVAIPPSASGHSLEEDILYGAEHGSPQKIAAIRAAHDKVRWLQSPNMYEKVETVDSSGAQVKKVTKWVTGNANQSPTNTPKAPQFSPLAADPKEWKEKQQSIKDARRSERISAGPQSHILECRTWEESARIKDSVDGVLTAGTISSLSGSSSMHGGTGMGGMRSATLSSSGGLGGVAPTVGTASKAIIQREYQQNARVYQRAYQPNPFTSETDADIEAYKREVELKNRSNSAEPPTTTTLTSQDGLSSTHDESHNGAVMPKHQSPGYTQETTFDPTSPDKTTTTITQKKDHSNFRRTKSDRFFRRHPKLPLHNEDTTHDSSALSDGEGTNDSPKSGSKKKKFKTPSLFKKKKHEKSAETEIP